LINKTLRCSRRQSHRCICTNFILKTKRKC